MNEAKKQYIQEQYTKLYEYINGDQLVCEYVAKAIDKYKTETAEDNLDYYLNTEALEKFFYFLTYIKINQEDKYTAFNPESWQVFYFANVYGIYRKDTQERKYTTSFLTMAKKQGKSTIGAIQSLYHLTYDGQIDGQNYFVSNSKESAGIALNYTKAIVSNSPALKKRVKQLQYYLKHETANNRNILKVLTADANRSEGLRGAFVLLDELHTIEDSALYDSLKSATVGITNPLISIITTRGFNTNYYQYQLEKYIKKVIDGTVTDDTIFGLIYELDNEDEITKPDCWIKSNPNLINPKILAISELKALYNSSKITLANLKSFVVKNLNIWYISADNDFIATDKLDKVFVDEIDEEMLLGETCYLGGDFSSNVDISAISLVFPPTEKHEKYIIKNWNWKTSTNKINTNGKDLTPFIASGELIVQDSEIMDLDIIFDKINELSKQYNIVNFGYDAANSLQLVKMVKDNLGMECTPVAQNAKTLNYPLKFVEKIIINEDVVIDNMCSKWQFSNVKLYVDTNGNYKAQKQKSKSSIDSVVAIQCALAVYFKVEYEGEQFNYEGLSI